jgi:hypothetical protein
MQEFDVSKPWVVLIEEPSTRPLANELAYYIELLRKEAGGTWKPPLILETRTIPSADAPIIVMRRMTEENGNGFSWRMNRDRLEITGNSLRGLYHGLFDFLMNLGFRWKTPGHEETPPKNRLKPPVYALAEAYGYSDSVTDINYCRRLLFDKNSIKKWEKWTIWAVRNRIDALIIPLSVKPSSYFYDQINKLAKKYDLFIEAGGWDLSNLVSRSRFFFHKEMFRMTDGKRDKAVNFCPTSPDTIKVLSKKAKKIFMSRQNTMIYHFWPDRGHENAWCSCLTCRAFTPDEQNRIAVTAVADVLRSILPEAKLSFYETSSEKTDIRLRPALFRVSRLPAASGTEEGGWFLAT